MDVIAEGLSYQKLSFYIWQNEKQKKKHCQISRSAEMHLACKTLQTLHVTLVIFCHTFFTVWKKFVLIFMWRLNVDSHAVKHVYTDLYILKCKGNKKILMFLIGFLGITHIPW